MEQQISQTIPQVFGHYDSPPTDPEAEKDYKLTHDPLTGLLNESGRDEALSYLESTMPGNFAALSLDLDKFKAVNTAHGRLGGNRMLKVAADTIGGTVRTDQTSNHPDRRKDPIADIPDLIATRPHGDEFDVLLPGVRTKEEADTVGRRILDNLELAGVKASFGSVVHEEGMDREGFIGKSDSELRMAKFRKHVEAFSSKPLYKRILSRFGASCIRRAGAVPPDFDHRDF